MSRMSKVPQENLGEALEAAVTEAMDDATYRKVKRCSYAQSAQDTIGHILGKSGNANSGGNNENRPAGNMNIGDPEIMAQLMTALLGQQIGQTTSPHQAFNRMRPMSRSMRQGSTRAKNDNRRSSWLQNQGGSGANGSSTQLPTIMEGHNSFKNNANSARTLSLSERALNAPIVRNFLQTLANVPQRLNNSDNQESSRGRTGRRNSETPLTQNPI